MTTRYDERTALVVVDMQNDFADPEGSLYVEGGEQVVPIINTEIARAREAGALVAYTQDWHPASTPHFDKDGGPWPVHCVQGTWGAELHPDLEVAGRVVQKGVHGEDGYSGFTARDPRTGVESSTGLWEHLRDHRVRRAVVVGLAGDVCVKATALDACAKGLETVVLADAIRSVNVQAGDDRRAIEEMEAAGVAVE